MSQTEFDPDRPEDSRGSSSGYLSKRDLRIVLIGMVLFFGALTPFYIYFRGETEASQCLLNMRAISGALGLYAQENDERMPPAYVVVGFDAPLIQNGRAVTWATVIQGYMNPRRTFRCPSAKPEEVAKCSGLKAGQTLEVTYGLYTAMQGKVVSQLASAANTVLIAETSNNGARNTYNPKPLVGGQDAFLIGFDSGNQYNLSDPAFQEDMAKISRITRLAFYETQDGKFDETTKARHRAGIHAIMADGSAKILKASAANVTRGTAGRILAPWQPD